MLVVTLIRVSLGIFVKQVLTCYEMKCKLMNLNLNFFLLLHCENAFTRYDKGERKLSSVLLFIFILWFHFDRMKPGFYLLIHASHAIYRYATYHCELHHKCIANHSLIIHRKHTAIRDILIIQLQHTLKSRNTLSITSHAKYSAEIHIN